MGSRDCPPYEVRIWFFGDQFAEPNELLNRLKPELDGREAVRLSRYDGDLLPDGYWEVSCTSSNEHIVCRDDGIRQVICRPEFIQRTIDPKNVRLQEYLKTTGRVKFDNFWLLIVADSSNLEMNTPSEDRVYTSNFDRTFLPQRNPDHLYELKTSPTATGK